MEVKRLGYVRTKVPKPSSDRGLCRVLWKVLVFEFPRLWAAVVENETSHAFRLVFEGQSALVTVIDLS